jgi:hypothetical protein
VPNFITAKFVVAYKNASPVDEINVGKKEF